MAKHFNRLPHSRFTTWPYIHVTLDNYVVLSVTTLIPNASSTSWLLVIYPTIMIEVCTQAVKSQCYTNVCNVMASNKKSKQTYGVDPVLF